MPNFSIAVAVLDFVPVLASATGYALLADGVARRRPEWAACAWAATAMIVTGGLCKASWKLLESVDRHPPAWLGDCLLPLIAPGLILFNHILGVALDRPVPKQGNPSSARWLTALLAVGALASGASWASGASATAGRVGLLATAIVASTVLIARCARAAFRSGLPVAACGFAFNGLALYGLGALSRLAPGNRAAWWQESVNLSAQAALLFAAWQWHRHGLPNAQPITARQDAP